MVMVYPFFHTAGLKSGVLASFLRGATLIPFPVFESQAVADLIEREKITVLPGPPSVFQSLLGDPGFDWFDLGSLRLSVTGAAVVPVELIARMRHDLHLDSVITAYGLTETHGTVTLCETNDSIETIATTVGHPLEGLELAVVDDEGSEVPLGETGEILVRGFNLMTATSAIRPPRRRRSTTRAGSTRGTSATSESRGTCGSWIGRRTSSSSAGSTCRRPRWSPSSCVELRSPRPRSSASTTTGSVRSVSPSWCSEMDRSSSRGARGVVPRAHGQLQGPSLLRSARQASPQPQRQGAQT